MEKRTPDDIATYLDDLGGSVLVAAWDRKELEYTFHRLALASPSAELWRVRRDLVVKTKRGRVFGVIPGMLCAFGLVDLVVWTRDAPYPDSRLAEEIYSVRTRIARSVLLDLDS